MKKIAIAGVLVLLALPILPRLIPAGKTLDRFQAAFEEGGYAVERASVSTTPQLEAIGQLSMTVDGAHVEIYHFDDEGKIAKQMEFQKPGPGSAQVDAFGLSELAAAVGAAKPKNKPVTVARNGKFLLVVTSEDDALRARIKATFSSL